LFQNTIDKPTTRIAFCHHTADVCGGSDQSLFELVTGLPREEFLPMMILKIGDPMADQYRAAGVDVAQIRLFPPRKAWELRKQCRYFFWFWPSSVRVAGAIRRFRADIVHVNTMYNLQGAVGAKLAGRPLVWHVREAEMDSVFARLIKTLVRLLADRVVAVSSGVAAKLQGCGDRLRVIHNGIDMAKYDRLPDSREARQSLGLVPDEPVITAIGRLEPWKGQHVLVEAVPRVLKEYPNAKTLVVGGPAANKPEYETQLRERCRELKISDKVIFTGIRKEVPEILAASDVLVLPTATDEPFGRTVVEAMAAGRPVVATAAGGPLDIVLDGETGWFVPPNDVAALAAKICDVIRDPDRARSMGENGRRRARERFSLERLVSDMTTLFHEMCQRPMYTIGL